MYQVYTYFSQFYWIMNYPLAIDLDKDSDEDEYKEEKGMIIIAPNINNTNNQNRKVKNLSLYDQRNHHRAIHLGINFEGKCMNRNCRVYHKMVWIPLGYGQFKYSEMQPACPCPICRVDLLEGNIVNIGYRYAKVKVVGRKENDKKNKIEFSDEENEGKLIVLSGDGTNKLTCWLFLTIQAYKIDESYHPPALELQLPKNIDIDY